MARMTKHDYREPSSLSRCLEAAIAWVDADADDDVGYHRVEMRNVKAWEAYLRARGWSPPKRRRQSVEVEALWFKFGRTG